MEKKFIPKEKESKELRDKSNVQHKVDDTNLKKVKAEKKKNSRINLLNKGNWKLLLVVSCLISVKCEGGHV